MAERRQPGEGRQYAGLVLPAADLQEIAELASTIVMPELKEMVKEAVKEVLVEQLEIKDASEFRRNQEYIASRRIFVDAVKKQGIIAATGLFVAAVCWLLWFGLLSRIGVAVK